MCSVLTIDENKAFTVKELKEYLKDKNDDLPVNIYVMKTVSDGVDEGFVLPLEALGTSGEDISLTCFDT